MRSIVLVFIAACGSIAGDDDASTEGDATTDSSKDACAFCFDGSSLDVVPSPGLCPASAPSVGSPCNLPEQDCEYGTNAYFCNEHFVCVSGTWQHATFLEGPCKDAEACDTISDGGACSAPGQVCPSGDASICVCSECRSGPPIPGDAAPPGTTWQCFTEKPGCSQEHANGGTACDLPDGSTCPFTAGACCTGFTESCENGVWISYPTEPCP